MLYEPLHKETSSSDFAHVKKVGVIGAGVSGLQMARSLLAHGYEVTVFDKAPNVGGLWRENYHSYGVQVPKQLYEFPDFPFKTVPWGEFPTGEQTQQYICAFADHYKLMPHIRLNTPVVALKERTGQKGWVFQLGEGGSEEFDFAVVATGLYSQVANMPAWTGTMGDFSGTLIHSSRYLSPDIVKDKKVLVIGSAKSAVDIAIDTSKVSKEPPTLLYRSAHWCTPTWIAGIIPFQYVFLSRLGQALVSWYKGPWPAGAPRIHTFLSYLLFPLMWLVFRVVELLFKIQRGQWGVYAPKRDVVADFYGYGHVLNTTFISKWRKGELAGKLGEVRRLVKGGVETETGETIEADVVICATGFRKTYDYLPAQTKQSLSIESDGLYLYRQIFPANVRDVNLAFCGSECATISNIMTYGIHAEYISRVLRGAVALPSEDAMRMECEVMKAWKRSWMSETSSRASYVLLHQTHYHDQLMRDMGEAPGRKWCLSEYFCPYQPSDYNGIIKSS